MRQERCSSYLISLSDFKRFMNTEAMGSVLDLINRLGSNDFDTIIAT